MDVYEAILSRRSIRRFKQKQIPLELLKKFVNGARLAPSAANLQPLEFLIINEKDLCKKIFDTLGWAAYIKPKWAPSENERPVAYIIMLINDKKNNYAIRDVSLASENIVLAAEEEKIGSCIMYKINREKLRELLKIPNSIIIDTVIALGYKAEDPVVVDFIDSVKYFRDENEVLHVPKRKLEDIIHINKF
ncbi:nitroreductase [Thermoplasmatales archaeon SG8-52-2]|nr:MAG: nitroreductase [Thermoplasmatales archaeon SG8-52-2]